MNGTMNGTMMSGDQLVWLVVLIVVFAAFACYQAKR